jgi:uncharacterized RDD family membrane protein YckC
MELKRAGLLLRSVAKSIDFILILAAAEALPLAGWLGGLIYLLISDGLLSGQSLGKKLTGLRVMNASGQACTIRDSIVRNSTLAAGLLLWKIPVLGWPLLGVVLALEFIILIGSKEGARLGDELAKTSVVEVAEIKAETKEES